MAEPLTIQLIKPISYTADDRGQLEVDAALQQDRIRFWGRERDSLGFGRDPFGEGMFGYGEGLGFGFGAFGYGPFGHGTDALTYATRAAFVAEDYQLRVRGVDPLGNTGDWSAATLHRHRPSPPAPTDSAITPGTSVQTWSWSDPADG